MISVFVVLNNIKQKLFKSFLFKEAAKRKNNTRKSTRENAINTQLQCLPQNQFEISNFNSFEMQFG